MLCVPGLEQHTKGRTDLGASVDAAISPFCSMGALVAARLIPCSRPATTAT
jgi:hypothetical protein